MKATFIRCEKEGGDIEVETFIGSSEEATAYFKQWLLREFSAGSTVTIFDIPVMEVKYA